MTTIFQDIVDLVQAAPAYKGYAPTGAVLPYVVSRPLIAGDLAEALAGNEMTIDIQFSLYCCGGRVEACYNLALDVMRDLQGKRVGGTTLSTSVGYVGAPVEGHYESQVTVQLNQGGI
jgi:hypothetical protein